MKSHLAALVFAVAVIASPLSALAESWIFRPSYYSHDPVTNVRIGRQYSAGPVFTRPTGGYISGGWRWQNASIIIGGQMFDNYNYFESWGQQGEKF